MDSVRRSAVATAVAVEGPCSVEGIDDPDLRPESACPRWPEDYRLLNRSSGELHLGSCKATNLCPRCARYYAVETCEMLWLDALAQGSPSLWEVFTTSRPQWDGERWRRSMAQVFRAVRRRWPAAEYAALVEFTTGYGPRSGGMRRPHLNVFWRGVPVEDESELWRVTSGVWCARMTALPRLQWVARVSEDRGGMRGLTRYVSLHFLKESQAPPAGWRGQRFRASRGYFVRPRSELRQEAGRALRLKRLIRVLGDEGLALLELEEREAQDWSLVHVRPVTWLEGPQRDRTSPVSPDFRALWKGPGDAMT